MEQEPFRLAGTTNRDRLLNAMAEALRSRGRLTGITVADVVRVAHVSKRTFYEAFADLNGCYLALLTDFNASVLTTVSNAVQSRDPWLTQVRSAVEAMMSSFAADSALTVSWARDAPGLGNRSRALQRETTRSFADLVQRASAEAARSDPNVRPLDSFLAMVVVAGVREVMTAALEDDRPVTGLVEATVRVLDQLTS